MRDAIRALVAGLEPWDSREAADRQAALDWIDSGAELFRLAKPATPPQHLVAYFVLLDGAQVLLGDHLLSGLWLPSGGHVDPGEHPRATVEREVMEELSVAADFLAPAPQFVTLEQTVGQTAGHWDVTLWYALRGSISQVYDFDRGEFHEVRWFAPDALPQDRMDPNLTRFLAKWRARAV